MSVQPRTCAYSLDASDTLVAYGGEWLAFARANGAPELENAIGHCIWEFIAGSTIQELYAVLFQRVRTRREKLTLPFRCDSPDVFRFMELDISAGEDAALHFVSRLLREQKRPHFPVLDRMISRSSSRLRVCSVCKRAQIEGAEWMEAESAVQRLHLFDSNAAPTLEHAVCDDCIRRLREPDGVNAA